MSLDGTLFERNPPTLERNWALFSRGIYRLDGKLLVILDVARLLDYELQG
jgi:purine-binding chemotaxis protein CheW